MKRVRRNRGIEQLKSRYGVYFVTPWCIGLLLFFLIPLLQSIYYAFSDVQFLADGLRVQFTGLANFRYIFTQEPAFTDNIAASMQSFAYSFPLIIVLSLVLAVILNGRFAGRTFFRALYFTPVIIAGGSVITLLLTMSTTDVESMAGSSQTGSFIEVNEILDMLGLPAGISSYLNLAISSIMNLLWKCGIQIVLFIAGMQSVPELHYEVARVEGASKWETFWFVTVPSLLRVLLLVAIFTAIELMTEENNAVMRGAYTYLESQRYGTGNAMLWSYFAMVAAVLGVVLLFYRAANRRWSD